MVIITVHLQAKEVEEMDSSQGRDLQPLLLRGLENRVVPSPRDRLFHQERTGGFILSLLEQRWPQLKHYCRLPGCGWREQGCNKQSVGEALCL